MFFRDLVLSIDVGSKLEQANKTLKQIWVNGKFRDVATMENLGMLRPGDRRYPGASAPRPSNIKLAGSVQHRVADRLEDGSTAVDSRRCVSAKLRIARK